MRLGLVPYRAARGLPAEAHSEEHGAGMAQKYAPTRSASGRAPTMKAPTTSSHTATTGKSTISNYRPPERTITSSE